jgi:uncharacterized membrane protein
VNGTPVFEQPPPSGPGTGFENFLELGTRGQGAFVAGANLVSITVVNDPWTTTTNPAGLRVEGTLVANRLAPPKSTFRGLGDLPGGETRSEAYALSADGATVVGSSGSGLGESGEAFRWRRGTGMEALGCVESYCSGRLVSRAHGVSADGGIVAGESIAMSDTGFPCGWVPLVAVFTWRGLGGFETHAAGRYYAFSAFSADGSTLAGDLGIVTSPSSCAPLSWLGGWVDWGEGATPVPADAPYGVRFARAVSADGSLVVGMSGTAPFFWSGGPSVRVLAESFILAGMSPDARVLVGAEVGGPAAVVWTETDGLRQLGLPSGASAAMAQYASFDGRLILGWVYTDHREVMIWLGPNPPRALKDHLEDEYGLDLTGWRLTGVAGLSNDGRTIAGNGVNPAGETEAWIAELALPVPEPAGWLLGVAALAALRGARRFTAGRRGVGPSGASGRGPRADPSRSTCPRRGSPRSRAQLHRARAGRGD